MMFELIGMFFVAMWAACFISGFFHWLEDTYCLDDTPIIGSYICEPNIDHHVDPNLMVRAGTFISRNKLQWAMAASAFGLIWLAGYASLFWLMTMVIVGFANEIHRWNHMSRNENSFIKFMKDTGLIQVQRQHSLHHVAPYKRYYCVVTSFPNAILERINFWRGLERVFLIVFGLHPKREGRRDEFKKLKKDI